MKKTHKCVLSLVLALAIVFSPISSMFVPSSAFAFGVELWPGANIDWYMADPNAEQFYISTPAELHGLAYLVNTVTDDPPLSGHAYNITFAGKTITLTNDIDLAAVNPAYTDKVTTFGDAWDPIGWGQPLYLDTNLDHWAHNPFMGTFEGNGFTVRGLSKKSLFGMVINATIKDLSTSGTLIKTSSADPRTVAGVVNQVGDSMLINLYSDVNLVIIGGSVFQIGGIATEIFGNTTAIGCTFNGTLDSTIGQYNGAAFGGIFGRVGFSTLATTATVIDCVNYADMTVHSMSGGIVAGTTQDGMNVIAADIVIKNCVNYGDITVGSANSQMPISSGGILGSSSRFPSSVSIDGCSNYGNVFGNLNGAGGLVGYIREGNKLSITNSYNQGSVTSGGAAAAGGIVGRVDNASGAVIENTYSTGTVSGFNAGGFAGLVNYGTINSVNDYYLDSSAPGAVDSADYAGVTALSSAEMKDPAFAEELGSAFIAVADGYPALAWQNESIPEPAVAENAIGIIRSGASTRQKGVFDIIANVPESSVNLIEATVGYDADLYDVTAVNAVGDAVVDVVKDNGDGTLLLVIGVANDAVLGEGSQVLARVEVAPKAGLTPDVAQAEILAVKAYGIGAAIDLAIDPNMSIATSALTYGGVDPGELDPLDVNGDGIVTAEDLSLTLYYFGYLADELPEGVGADVNGDGTVNMADITALVNELYPAA